MRDEVDLPSVHALQREWRRNPPVHHLVAAYMKYKPPAAESTSGDAEPEISGLMGETGPLPVRKLVPIDTTAFDQAMQEKQSRSSAHG